MQMEILYRQLANKRALKNRECMGGKVWLNRQKDGFKLRKSS